MPTEILFYIINISTCGRTKVFRIFSGYFYFEISKILTRKHFWNAQFSHAFQMHSNIHFHIFN